MKRVLLIIALIGLAGTAVAQPKARRNQQQAQQQQQQQQQSRQGQMTQRARIQYPVAEEMPEDVVWRRDIYREIDLNVGNNGGLYYPIQPKGKQMNLFTYIFKLAQNGYIPIYEYSPTESEERFDDSAKRTFKDMLDDQGVFYEEKGGKLVVDNSDIPSEEVRRYFLKESAYYDQANSTFHRKVLAICPVRMDAFPTKEQPAEQGADDDEFSFGGVDLGGGDPPRPMFWVNFNDLAPFLNRQNIMVSDKNVASTMSLEDFFALNRYEGTIYKVTNMLGRNLADYCRTDSALAKEQKRIEAELAAFRDHIFGDKQQQDSIDSIANADSKSAKAKKQRSRQTKEKTEKVKSSRSSSSSTGVRHSVRRERH